MTNHEVDEALKKALSSQEVPSEILNRRIVKKAKENEMRKKNTGKRWVSVAAAAAIFLGVSTTAAAAYHLLNASSVAEELSGDLAESFETKNILDNELKQVCGPYEITLLGVLTGEKLDEKFCEEMGITERERTYAAVAIARTDGSPMLEESGMDFFISPLIEGLNPKDYNIASMGGGYTWDVIDGVMYYIVDCYDINCFADRTIYLTVLDRTFYSVDAYAYDETTGAISRKDTYDGVNLLFELPMDKSLADPKKAAQYLKNLEEKWNQNDVDAEVPGELPGVKEVLERGVLKADSVKECVPDSAGTIEYSYSDGENEVYTAVNVEEFSAEKSEYVIGGWTGVLDQSMDCLLFHRDADGVVTGMIYTIDMRK